MLKIIFNKDIEQLAGLMADYIYEHLKNGDVDKFEYHKDLNIICIDWCDTLKPDEEPSQIIICFNSKDLFFICENEQVLNTVKTTIESIKTSDNNNELILYRFFAKLLDGDTNVLEKLEDEIVALDDELLTTSNKDCAHEIIEFRRKLLSLKRYYEQLNKIFENLVENENSLIDDDALKYFRVLDSRVDRLFATVLNLQDYVTQLREAYQANVDIELNNLMKTFTIVTSIFLPLSLLAGWYGMNLKMPEFQWNYGYPIIIATSVIIVFVMVIIFKKKKWF